MSDRPPPDLSELHSVLGVPTPGLLLLRYRSALVLDELIRTVRPLLAPRPLREIRFDPRIPGPAGNPDHLAAECRSLAGADTPVLFLRPEPGAAADLPEMAPFWKELNARREALGATQALIVLCLDDAHTAAAFHHAKDLLSWCSPKFEFLTLTGLGSEERRLTATKKTLAPLAFQAPAAEWAALHPLWEQTLASGRPLTAELTRRLVLPLLRAAVDNGMVTAGSTLIRQAGNLAFYNEHQRGDWLNLCGELAVAQGDLAGALRFFTEDKAIAERLAASDPANAAWQRALSVSLIKLGNLAVAQGDLAGALRSFTESKAIRERLAASDPAHAGWQRDLSVSLEKLGELAVAQGDLAGALRSFSGSKAIAERLAASDPANAGWQRDLIISFERLGDLAQAKGDLAAATGHFEKSRQGWAKLIQQDPTNISLQRGVTVPLNRLGDLAVAQGDLAGALRSFTESKAIVERLAASDPANAAWQRDLSVSLEKLGELAVAQGDLAGALRFFTEAKAIAERLAASDPANAEWQRDLSYSLTVVAQVFMKLERWREALPMMGRSLAIDERLANSDPTNVMWQNDAQVSRRMVAQLRAKAAGS